MNAVIVGIDPNKSEIANLVYKYGNEQYETGFWHGTIYASIGLLFLFCVREYTRS
jgi:hypothetical protein